MNKGPADLPRPTTAEERKTFVEMGSLHATDLKNPCMKEEKLSYKCLDENNYDHKRCTQTFLNYKNCQKFWSRVKSDRRKNGITPELPRPEDRDKIKREYMQRFGSI